MMVAVTPHQSKKTRLADMTHAELVVAAYKWLLRETVCGVAFREYKSSRFSTELPDVIGFDTHGESYVIECKASRADFHADASKPFRVEPATGMGVYRYYCCPVDLIRKQELPRSWGLIYVNDSMESWIAHDPYAPSEELVYKFERNKVAEYKVMYSALRRLDLRGRLEELYDKAVSRIAAPQIGKPRAESDSVWCKKSNPNQKVTVLEDSTGHVVSVRSVKTGIADKIKADKFYREYEVCK